MVFQYILEEIKINESANGVSTNEDTSENDCDLNDAVTTGWCGRVAHLGLERSCRSLDKKSLDFSNGILHLCDRRFNKLR